MKIHNIGVLNNFQKSQMQSFKQDNNLTSPHPRIKHDSLELTKGLSKKERFADFLEEYNLICTQSYRGWDKDAWQPRISVALLLNNKNSVTDPHFVQVTLNTEQSIHEAASVKNSQKLTKVEGRGASSDDAVMDLIEKYNDRDMIVIDVNGDQNIFKFPDFTK